MKIRKKEVNKNHKKAKIHFFQIHQITIQRMNMMNSYIKSIVRKKMRKKLLKIKLYWMLKKF